MQHLSDSANLSEASVAQSGILFQPTSWVGLKQQVLHLAQFGGSIQVVWGAEGAGKSTFLHLLLSEPEAALVAYRVPENCTLETLFRALLHKLGLRPGADMQVGQLIAALRSHCQSLERSQFRAVVVLDDAHRLGSSELATVISILQGNVDSGFGLHLVLLAEPELLARLDQLQLVDISIHDMALPAFAPSELSAMLTEYQQAHNWAPLSKEQLQRFWTQSGGLPGVALQLAAKQTNTPVQSSLWSLNGWPIGHFAALALLCILLVWALLVRQAPLPPDSVSPPATPESRPIIRSEPTGGRSEPTGGHSQPLGERLGSVSEGSEEQVPLSEETEVPGESLYTGRDSLADGSVSPQNADPSPVSPEGVAPGTLGANLDAQDPGVVDRDTVDFDENRAEALDQDQGGGPASQRSEEDSFESGAPMQPAEAVVGEVAPAPGNTESASPQTQSKSPRSSNRVADTWLTDSMAKLRAMPGQGYVLQVMATADLLALHHFVTRQPNQEHLLGYTTARDGQPLHILVEGFYADRESASAAMANLPVEQRRGGPWPKRVDAVHEEMQE